MIHTHTETGLVYKQRQAYRNATRVKNEGISYKCKCKLERRNY